jgi:hypothetical protein
LTIAFVEKLGKDAFGCASLVYSATEKTLLVRIAISPNSINLSNIADEVPEPALALIHPSMPKIEGVHSYNTLVPKSELQQRYKLQVVMLGHGSRGDLQIFMQDHSIPNDLYNKAIRKALRGLVVIIDSIPQSGIVHRDLREGNIFLNWRAKDLMLEAKLGDFGISFDLCRIAKDTGRCRLRLHAWKVLIELLTDLEPMPSGSDTDIEEGEVSPYPCTSEMEVRYGMPRPREATDPKLGDLGCILEAMAPHASCTKGNVRVQDLVDLIDDAASAYDDVE